MTNSEEQPSTDGSLVGYRGGSVNLLSWTGTPHSRQPPNAWTFAGSFTSGNDARVRRVGRGGMTPHITAKEYFSLPEEELTYLGMSVSSNRSTHPNKRCVMGALRRRTGSRATLFEPRATVTATILDLVAQ